MIMKRMSYEIIPFFLSVLATVIRQERTISR